MIDDDDDDDDDGDDDDGDDDDGDDDDDYDDDDDDNDKHKIKSVISAIKYLVLFNQLQLCSSIIVRTTL